MLYYDTESVYINSCTDARAKIVAINACIDALLTSVLNACVNADVQEYLLNDGQTIIKTAYRDPQQVIRSISALKLVRQQYENDINGYSRRLIDSKNLYNHNIN